MRRFVLYLIRWQLSTPILAPIVAAFKHSNSLFGTKEDWIGATIANLIGGCIFFWVDKFIFTSPLIEAWYLKENAKCDSCRKIARVQRLVKTKDYDRTDSSPVYLCKICSLKKIEELKKRGINVSEMPK
ncbi:MAG: hypothetical protein A2539_05140 [Elusimicrobia bacterium RIFOXYD2_FULL_34_15]|nr:MAG: hypothetical protein A2539_05140 [Elusimicrobia bacterium RIFOXYD2_FULL_34_15]